MPDWTARLIVLPLKNDWFLACSLPFSVRSILSHIPSSFYAFKKSYKISFSIDLIDVSLFSHQRTGRHSHLLNRKWLETHLFISPWAKGLLYYSWLIIIHIICTFMALAIALLLFVKYLVLISLLTKVKTQLSNKQNNNKKWYEHWCVSQWGGWVSDTESTWKDVCYKK